MKQTLTRDQYWALFQKLPEQMKTFILSQETGINIFDICDKNKVGLDKISDVARAVGRVLLGTLPPNELENVLKEEMALKKTQARLTAQEIQKIIFSPIKEDLEKLYSIKLDIIETEKPSSPDEHKISETTKKKTPRKDSYRETVEKI